MKKDIYQVNFGKTLLFYRKMKGLSQEQLALISELDRSYIGGVERGERNVSLINIHKIANALEIEAYKLLENIENDKNL